MKKSRPQPPKRPGTAPAQRLPLALQLARTGAALHPAVDTTFDEALRLHKAGDLAAADPLYRQVLQARPDHGDALQLLGTIEGQRGHTEASLSLLQRAVAVSPDNGHAHGNLGKALAQAQRLPEALSSFQRACELLPDNAKALVNLGRTHFKLNQPEQALALFDRVLELEPGSAITAQHRCEVLIQLSQSDSAYRSRAVEALYVLRKNRHDETAVRFALAALGVGEPPLAMPADTVTKLFDGYADRFDDHLTNSLHYRGPECVANALQLLSLPPPGRVLDLGCGTGLCGHLLRPLARELVGVDLSPRMLEKARERGVYDDLVCADLLTHLRTAEPGVSLVLAADVFIYLGDLGAVFAAVSALLVEGGLFVFSVESTEGSTYVLKPTRRYAHPVSYVEGLSRAHGFETVLCERAALRQESGADVPGTLFAFRRLAA